MGIKSNAGLTYTNRPLEDFQLFVSEIEITNLNCLAYAPLFPPDSKNGCLPRRIDVARHNISSLFFNVVGMPYYQHKEAETPLVVASFPTACPEKVGFNTNTVDCLVRILHETLPRHYAFLIRPQPAIPSQLHNCLAICCSSHLAVVGVLSSEERTSAVDELWYIRHMPLIHLLRSANAR